MKVMSCEDETGTQPLEVPSHLTQPSQIWAVDGNQSEGSPVRLPRKAPMQSAAGSVPIPHLRSREDELGASCSKEIASGGSQDTLCGFKSSLRTEVWDASCPGGFSGGEETHSRSSGSGFRPRLL